MNQDRQHLSFGRYLRAVRLEKGIDLEAVAKATCITSRMLTHIENEVHDHLPAEVFLKGFLRAYARQVGVDGDEVVRRYLSSMEERTLPDETIQPSVVGRTSRFWLRLIMVLLGLAIIVALAVTMLTNQAPPGAKKEGPPLSEPVSTAPPEPVPAAGRPMAVKGSGDLDILPGTASPQAEGQTLKVVTLAPTWLKIIIDGRAPEEYNLKAGDRLDFEARSGFNILIGNAAGVDMTLNGQPVAITENAGQAVTLRLP